jgi:hypothetical protein
MVRAIFVFGSILGWVIVKLSIPGLLLVFVLSALACVGMVFDHIVAMATLGVKSCSFDGSALL